MTRASQESASVNPYRRNSTTQTVRSARVTWISALAVMLAIAAVSVACGPPPPPPTLSSGTPVPNPAHRGFVNIQYCVDESDSYSPKLYQKANTYIETSILAAVRANQDGVSAYVTYLYDTPDVASSTALAVTIKPLPPYSGWQMPAPASNGTYGGDANAKNTVTANKTAQAGVAADKQVTAAVSAEEARVTKEAQPLLDFPRPKTYTTSSSCLIEASKRFANIHGDDWLVIASNLQDASVVETQDVRLPGAHVRVIFFNCSSDCASRESTWNRLFTSVDVSASDIHYFENGDSDTLPPLLSGKV